MNHNGLTRDLYVYELNPFKEFMKIKKLLLLPQSLSVSKPYGVTMEMRLLQHYFLVGPITA